MKKIFRMFSANITTLPRLPFILLAALCVFFLVSRSPLYAAGKENPQSPALAERSLPEPLGTVVYQSRPEATSRIYIIANGHRSAISGANATATVQAQMETFRIGEWLIKQKHVELLLPEGFFGTMGRSEAPVGNDSFLDLDNQALKKVLTDTSHFINAELLLHDKYGIGLEQVEDRKLYRAVKERLQAALGGTSNASGALFSEIAHLQQLRSAHLLHAAPAVVAAAYRQGRIDTPNAMLTIGLSHLDDIISLLETGDMAPAVLEEAGRDSSLQATAQEQPRQTIGITIVVPRSLMTTQIASLQRPGAGETDVFTR